MESLHLAAAPWRTRQRALARLHTAIACKLLFRTTLTRKCEPNHLSHFESRFFRKSLFLAALSHYLAFSVQQPEPALKHYKINTYPFRRASFPCIFSSRLSLCAPEMPERTFASYSIGVLIVCQSRPR